MKKVLTIVIAASVLLGGVALAQSSRFSDVTEDKHGWAIESINWAVDNNITAGIGDGLFAPDSTLTRAQMVTFLKRYHDNVVVPALGNAHVTTTTTQAPTTTRPPTTTVATASAVEHGDIGNWFYYKGTINSFYHTSFVASEELLIWDDCTVSISTEDLWYNDYPGNDNRIWVSFRSANGEVSGNASDVWWSDEKFDSNLYAWTHDSALLRELLRGTSSDLAIVVIDDYDSEVYSINVYGVDAVLARLGC